MHSLLGIGVFNADGESIVASTPDLPELKNNPLDELWKFHRSMTRPFFSKERISHFDNFDRHAMDALKQMKTRLREGYAIDWQVCRTRMARVSTSEHKIHAYWIGPCVALHFGFSHRIPIRKGRPLAV